eukprot:TRINITY_DN5415_c0_g2_i1.p1 TRINITY_DN5415_c0_g2~~TRINITY_DN5415_c0_g2_i1.p1  ORF type:complete len:488 (-),score=164.93 TRINITY_DN5415_c0_g2_i1:340-1803(-)
MASTQAVLQEVRLQLALHLPPKYMGAEMQRGIDARLNGILMSYNEELRGILLAYWNPKLDEQVAHIMAERPELHMKMSIDALLFTPAPGSILTGVVNKIGEDHIGLLVFGIFNASIPAANLPNMEFTDTNGPSWVDKQDPSRSITQDMLLQFRVTSYHVADRIIALVGALNKGWVGGEGLPGLPKLMLKTESADADAPQQLQQLQQLPQHTSDLLLTPGDPVAGEDGGEAKVQHNKGKEKVESGDEKEESESDSDVAEPPKKKTKHATTTTTTTHTSLIHNGSDAHNNNNDNNTHTTTKHKKTPSKTVRPDTQPKEEEEEEEENHSHTPTNTKSKSEGGSGSKSKRGNSKRVSKPKEENGEQQPSFLISPSNSPPLTPKRAKTARQTTTSATPQPLAATPTTTAKSKSKKAAPDTPATPHTPKSKTKKTGASTPTATTSSSTPNNNNKPATKKPSSSKQPQTSDMATATTATGVTAAPKKRKRSQQA